MQHPVRRQVDHEAMVATTSTGSGAMASGMRSRPTASIRIQTQSAKQCQAVDERCEYLEAVVAVGQPVVVTPARKSHRPPGQTQR